MGHRDLTPNPKRTPRPLCRPSCVSVASSTANSTRLGYARGPRHEPLVRAGWDVHGRQPRGGRNFARLSRRCRGNSHAWPCRSRTLNVLCVTHYAHHAPSSMLAMIVLSRLPRRTCYGSRNSTMPVARSLQFIVDTVVRSKYRTGSTQLVNDYTRGTG